jgi:FtsP/CotA-like multicopper oxidase with cupredoxin domain
MAPDMLMSPAMAALRPSVSPWVPGAGVDPAKLPFARSRETLHLRSGDTLKLVASLVRRTVAGRTFVGYAYNGQIPGPLLVVPQGATLIVQYRNDTDLPSSVHWHGVRLDNRYDGADGVTQDPVPTGGSFTYLVHFPDAGIYWYHVHHREDIAQPLGLYGNILVTENNGAKDRAPPVNETKVLAIGDLLLDATGPAPWGREASTNALMGRFGNVFLVNGEVNPNWTVKRGSVVRFYLTNVSTARSYNLSLDGASMKVVASDAGSFVNEMPVSSIVIAPAERYVVDVEFPKAGDVVLANRVLALSHMTGTLYPEVDTLATVKVTGEQAEPDYGPRFASSETDSLAASEIDRYRKYFDRPVDKELRLTMQLRQLPQVTSSMLNGVSVPVDWNDGMGMMNWALTPHEISWTLQSTDTVLHTMDLGWHFPRGSVVKVRIFNDATMPHAMAHAIHVHGQRFLVLSYNGLPNADPVWKDTVLIPAGGTVDLLLDLANPGRWLLHCHIAEHMEAGMMGTFTVGP